MRLKFFALFALLLTACAPAVYLTPGAGDVLPAEAQRVIDRATATAAAQGTQDARATQTDLSGRQTATAARQSTLDALQGRQTEVSLQITAQAGAAAATDTQAARTQAAGATMAAATPTAAALVAQATAQAAQDARRTAQAGDVAEFWATVRVIVLALLIVAGLTAICVVALDRVTRISVARLASKRPLPAKHFECYRLAIGPSGRRMKATASTPCPAC